MKIINPYYVIRTKTTPDRVAEVMKNIEDAARTCYKSEDNITESTESAERIIRMLIKNGHEAMLEHDILSVKFICDRAIANEIVRHRMASFGQESTRYCCYAKDKFGNEITVIRPFFYMDRPEEYAIWEVACEQAEQAYLNLIRLGSKPEEARAVLPLGLKTELVVTANFREWRHIIKLRSAKDAHPQIRELMTALLHDLQDIYPILFADFEEE